MYGLAKSSCCLLSVLTYTRGFWLALAFTAILFFALFFPYWKHCLKCAGILALSLVVLLGASWAAYRTPSAAVAVLERFDPSLIVIMPSRKTYGRAGRTGGRGTLSPKPLPCVRKPLPSRCGLWENTHRLGSGLGKNLDGLRTDGEAEYMYQDMWMKSGIIGLGLFLFSCFWQPRFLICRVKTPKEERKRLLDWKSAFTQAVIWNLAVLGVAITSYFNPFLTTPMGILVVLFAAAAVNLSQQSKSTMEEFK